MQLIFDFDGTITEKDTISELANAGLEFQKTQRGNDLGATWDGVVKAYLDDYQNHKESYTPGEEDRRSVQDEVDYLAGLRSVESASLDRVDSSGVFAGLTPTGLFQMGVDALESKKVIIREGFREIIDLAREQGWVVGIISANWSTSFIRGVLHQYSIPIVSNEVGGSDGKIRGPQCLDGRLSASAGKLEALRHEFADASGGRTLYFGDSATDLDCVLRGGVVISRDESCSLIRTLRRIGFETPHVKSYGNDPKQPDVYWASDFREVIESGLLRED